MKPFARSWLAHVAALLAVMLLAFATAKSVVMQAEMAMPWANAPMCGDMPGHGSGGDPHEHHKALAFCAVCAAAAHAPTEARPAVPRTPIFVAWRVAPQGEHTATRDLRLDRPKARGPPEVLLAA